MRFFLIIFISVFMGLAGFAQEILTGLQVNPVVKAGWLESNRLKAGSDGLDTIPMTLPFFDDFSDGNIFPSRQRWIDNYAFENNDIPVYPVNLGAMTLDAINDSGNIYPHAVPGPASFIADHLTSRYIRLDSVFTPVARALSPADSVYLSFFYQPQGRGKAPQANDSLILEFLVTPAHDSILPDTTIAVPDVWRKMWYTNGMSLDTFNILHNRYFVQVMVPVKENVFFSKKFRFRFYNYASLASSSQPDWQCNTDDWNLDNVYLNSNRNRYDTVYRELRFIYPPVSMLKRYEAMPYPQYCNDPTNEMRDTLDVLISNRDTLSHKCSYNYYVTQQGSSFSKSYNGGTDTIFPFYSVPYVTYQPFAHPTVSFFLPVNSTDSATFLVKHVVKEVTPGSDLADTIQAYQKFFNYYAYDNGTPEASYGLTPKGSKLAYRFKLNKSPDTLRAVRMYFNRTLSGSSIQWFNLCVWNDNAGKPGDTIASQLVLPKYADSINKFVTYHFDPPVSITGTFYIGWIQTTSDNLCLGFDRYNNSQSEIFININGTWENSAMTGSLMIRPVVGKPIPVGIGETAPKNTRITVYPNPVNGSTLHLLNASADGKTLFPGSTVVTVLDLFGRVRISSLLTGPIDVSTLGNGIYFLRLTDAAGSNTGMAKFIISR